MPPTITYTIISTPTTTIVTILAAMPRNVMPGLMPSSDTARRRRPSGPAGRRSTRRSWRSTRPSGPGAAASGSQHVGHREPARVAHQLGDQQQRHQPGDQEADGVQEAVVAVQRDDAGDAEEGRGRHVVAADRHAVLEAGERPAAGVEVGGGPGLPAGPDRDAEGDRDEQREQRDRQRLVSGTVSSAAACTCSAAWTLMALISRLLRSRRGVRRRAGRSCGSRSGRTSSAIRNVETNCSTPKINATLMWPTTLVLMKSRA